MYAVALLSPPYATLTYAASPDFPPDFWRQGLRVAVPLGKGALRAGVILGAADSAPEGVRLREICWPLEAAPLLDADAVALARAVATRQSCTPGAVWGHLLPAGLRSTQVRLRDFVHGMPRLHALAAVKRLPEEERRVLAAALLEGRAGFVAPGADSAAEERCILRVDPPWPVRPAAVKQAAVLDFLLAHGPVSRRALARAVEGSGPALAALVRAGHVYMENGECSEPEAGTVLMPPPPRPFILSPAQMLAVEDCGAALHRDAPDTRLLFGVTGSGKTAVYLELIRQCLEMGRSAMLLAPEVALAQKLRRDAALALPDAPLFFYHGYQSPRQREHTFRALAERTAPCVVVGTRSALFLPAPRLGAILLDEEHDASFKQDEGLSYQAKEVAWFRVRQSRGLLVLGSATPDIKTFHAAQQGSLSVLRLPARVGGGTAPSVELVDMSGPSGPSLLAPASEQALLETISRGEQAVILLNRRGYAPQMRCQDCATVVRCPHCEISLTYHRSQERLVCHYCGYSLPFPSPCMHCKGLRVRQVGEGTERLAEHVELLCGAGNVLRLDRDSTRRPGRMEEILETFARREAQVLVGTQMLSKGHHFPGVTLAMVADGDVGLNLPDYRAAERTFQLLVQSSGRAGRGDLPGRVLIQTRDTRHYCWKHVRTADFEGFYEEEIGLREKRRYPPFVRLARLHVAFPLDFQEYNTVLQEIGDALHSGGAALGVTVLGPAPAPLAVLRGMRRFHCLLKAADWTAMRSLHFMLLARISCKACRFYLDLDPVNML